MSLSTRSVAGSPARLRDTAAPSAPPAPVMATTRRAARHTSRYPPSTLSTVPVTKAEASEARNWYAPARSVGAPQRRWAVCPVMAAESSGWLPPVGHRRIEPPRGHHVDGDAAGARSRARPLATRPAPPSRRCRRPAPARPFPQDRAGEDQPPALTHDPGRGPGPQEGAGEVHLEDLAPDRGVRVRRGPATIGEIPALQIQTSTPPHSATVASATASLKSSSVTSPLSTRDGRARSRPPPSDRLGAGHQGHRGAGLREGMGQQRAEAAAGAGDHHPLPRDRARAGNDSGISMGSIIARSLVVPTSTIHYDRDRGPSSLDPISLADLIEMHRRMLLDPRFRAAGGRPLPRRRGPRLRPPLHRAGGAAVGACWPLARADVITSTHRGHGHCLAKGLDPLGMFAELMAKAGGTNRGRGGSMHIADPNLGSSAPTASWPPAFPSPWARRPQPSLRSGGGVAVAFFGDGAPAAGRLPRSTEPGRRVAAAGHLLLREQRLCRVLPRIDPARGIPRAAGGGLRHSLRRRRRQ
jgi:hypothetical protein